MDNPRLKARGPDGLHHPVELPQPGGQILSALFPGVELGADARHGHIGQVAVDREDLLRLVGQEAAEAHASVIASDARPSQAIRASRGSSMRVALELVKEGRAQACVGT